MKKFLIKASIFSIPIICCWLFIILIDPCNIYSYFKIIDNITKLKIINNSPDSQPRGNLIWKVCEFKRTPYNNIIIGDSQSFDVKEELISELTGNKFYNFSIPGANIETKFSIFWFAAKHAKLNHVIFQLSFPNWNMNEKSFFPLVQDYIDKPFLYLFNSDALDDSFQNIKYIITKKIKSKKGEFEFPIIDDNKNAFNSYLKSTYNNYKYPEYHFEELKKIVSYCKKNEISIEFLILPIHQMYYDYLISHNIIQINDKFITEISLLAKTHNYSFINNINKKEINFNGFFHPKPFITDSITRLIWGGKNQFSGKLKNDIVAVVK